MTAFCSMIFLPRHPHILLNSLQWSIVTGRSYDIVSDQRSLLNSHWGPIAATVCILFLSNGRNAFLVCKIFKTEQDFLLAAFSSRQAQQCSGKIHCTFIIGNVLVRATVIPSSYPDEYKLPLGAATALSVNQPTL